MPVQITYHSAQEHFGIQINPQSWHKLIITTRKEGYEFGYENLVWDIIKAFLLEDDFEDYSGDIKVSEEKKKLFAKELLKLSL